MRRETTQLRIPVSICVTNIRLFSSVSSSMISETIQLRKSFSTCVTDIWLFSSVSSFMLSETIIHRNPFPHVSQIYGVSLV